METARRRSTIAREAGGPGRMSKHLLLPSFRRRRSSDALKDCTIHHYRATWRTRSDDRQPLPARSRLPSGCVGGQTGTKRSTGCHPLYSGAAGLGSAEVRPGDIIAISTTGSMTGRTLLRRHQAPLGAGDERGPPICGPGRVLERGHSRRRFRLVTTIKSSPRWRRYLAKTCRRIPNTL